LIRDELCQQARADFDNLPEDQRSRFSTFDDYFESIFDVGLGSFLCSPMGQTFLDHNPTLSLRQVHCPVLALFGENDLRSPPEEHRLAMMRALEEGECTDYQIKVIPDANHTFYSARAPSTEFVPGFLDSITGWLVEKVQVQ
jgi:pimeloyl-ACP methyl ester carboxylesterase